MKTILLNVVTGGVGFFLLLAAGGASPFAAAGASGFPRTHTLFCGGLRFAKFYVTADENFCMDSKRNKYLVTFTGGGISPSPVLGQGFIIRVHDDGAVEGTYMGSFIGGQPKIPVSANIGYFGKVDHVGAKELLGTAQMFGLSSDGRSKLGMDLAAQVLVISPIK